MPFKIIYTFASKVKQSKVISDGREQTRKIEWNKASLVSIY